MDTLTHALSGALVGRLLARSAKHTDSRPTTPVWQTVVAGTAAATFPDIDFVLGFVSELTYLRGHRGVTHSLLLMPLWALLVAWIMAGLFRLRRGAQPAPDWRAFYLVACVGIFVHILGDLITQFGTMILAPLSDQRFAWGTTFIIDLVFSGIIVAGLVGSAIWRRSRVPATLASVALVGWVGLSAVARDEAIALAQAHANTQAIPAVAISAVPRPASPFNWTAIVFDGERYHYAHINTRRSVPLEADDSDNFIRRLSAEYLPVGLAQWHTVARFGDADQTPSARKVWSAEAFAFFRWFAMFPVLDRIETHAEGQCVNFRDLRFETPGREHIPFRYGLCGDDSGWRLFERLVSGPRWVMD